MTQDELKKAVGWAALQYVQPGTIVGVGTGSTAAHFIDALGTMKGQIEGAVSSSDASTEKLKSLGIHVLISTKSTALASTLMAQMKSTATCK
ncbi:ribose-5-phosphate isomerase A [Escherichia coli]|nr:ribose-5-phosphate isomerase A [Escherichia coli]STN66271.1 ribose-5-phosphate isomerase A [Escherichia coli]